MLDSFLEVTYEREKKAQANNHLVETMKNLPDEMLQKIASGEMKLAYHDDEDWLEKFKGTQLLGKAIELEKQELQIEMDQKAARRERDDKSDTNRTASDQICIEKKMLDLELASSEAGASGPAAPVATPAPTPAAPAPAPAAPPVPVEAKTASVQKEAISLKELEQKTVTKYQEAGKKWGRKRGARTGATGGSMIGGIGGTLAGLAAGGKGGRGIGALKGLAAGTLGGLGVGGARGAVRGGKAGERMGERAGRQKNVRRRQQIINLIRQARQKQASVSHFNPKDEELYKKAFIGALGGKVLGMAGKAVGALAKPGTKAALGKKVRGAATTLGGEGGQALGTQRLKKVVGVGTLGAGALGARSLMGGQQ